MRYKTTDKDLKHAFNLVSAGYCDLQRALNYVSPKAYTSSKMYGWRADVYEFDDFTIVTGYATPGHAVSIPYDLCKKIESDCQNQTPEIRAEILKREITTFLKSQKK